MTTKSYKGPEPKALDADHKCFGCGKQIADHEPHIHTGLDEFAEKVMGSNERFGLDDLLSFAFCADCTEPGGPYHFESHEVASNLDKSPE